MLCEIDDSFICMTPEERDQLWLKEYGMTFEQWQKEDPPMTDEEFKKSIEKDMIYIDKNGKKRKVYPDK